LASRPCDGALSSVSARQPPTTCSRSASIDIHGEPRGLRRTQQCGDMLQGHHTLVIGNSP
jgi:hypothetical protein